MGRTGESHGGDSSSENRLHGDKDVDRFSMLFEAMPDPCVIVDAKGRVSEVNRGAEEAVGYRREELVGKLLSELPAVVPSESRRIALIALARLAAGQRVTPFELEFVSKPGKRIWMEVNVTAASRDGKPVFLALLRDISERRRTREALKESEENFRALAENANDAIMIATGEGEYVYANKRSSEVTGYDAEELQKIGLRGLFHPDEVAKVEDTYRRRLSGKPVERQYETRIVHKDGRSVPVELTAARTIWRGEPASIVIMRDVTERKKAEKESKEYAGRLEETVRERTRHLEESEKKFRDLVELLPQGLFEIDTDFKVTFANRAMLEMAGYSEQDLARGIHAFELFKEEDRNRVEENIRRRLGGESTAGNEYALLRKDGTVLHVLAYSSAILREGKPAGIRGIIVDITDRKKNEEQIMEQDQMMDALLSNMPIATMKIGENGIVTESRGVSLEALGLSSGQTAETNILHAYPGIADHLKRATSGGTEHFEARLQHEGRDVYLDCYIFFDSARGKGAIGFAIDVTDRKEMEYILNEARRLAAIGETAAMVGHDLRNPLQAIGLASYLAREELVKGDTRLLRDRLGLIQTQVEYMNKIVWDLQDYVRPIRPGIERADLKSLLDSTLSAIVVPNSITVDISIDPDFPALAVDPTLMRRSLSNLVMNAIEAMPKGGRLTIRGEKTPTAMCISVKDTGGGLSETAAQRVFEPLGTTKAKGMGLGLPIAKRLVEAHGGSISVKTEPGKGATFTIALPLKSGD